MIDFPDNNHGNIATDLLSLTADLKHYKSIQIITIKYNV